MINQQNPPTTALQLITIDNFPFDSCFALHKPRSTIHSLQNMIGTPCSVMRARENKPRSVCNFFYSCDGVFQHFALAIQSSFVLSIRHSIQRLLLLQQLITYQQNPPTTALQLITIDNFSSDSCFALHKPRTAICSLQNMISTLSGVRRARENKPRSVCNFFYSCDGVFQHFALAIQSSFVLSIRLLTQRLSLS